MNKSECLTSLEDLIEAEPGSVNEDSVLAETIGWDSMAIMGFIAFADEEFKLSPAPKVIKECKTMADLLQILGF
jgi:acyl carrier protein